MRTHENNLNGSLEFRLQNIEALLKSMNDKLETKDRLYSVADAARKLGMHVQTIYRKVRELGLSNGDNAPVILTHDEVMMIAKNQKGRARLDSLNK